MIKIRKKILKAIVVIFALFMLPISGCTLIMREDIKNVVNAYTDENSLFNFYVFKAQIKNVRELSNPNYEDEKYFLLNIDYNDFEQRYGDDNYTTADGSKRWESAYSSFNKYEFMIIPSNYRIIKENGGYDFLSVGTVILITANNYYGWDGWIFPILSLSLDDTDYLEFETGKGNYLNYVCAGFKDT